MKENTLKKKKRKYSQTSHTYCMIPIIWYSRKEKTKDDREMIDAGQRIGLGGGCD